MFEIICVMAFINVLMLAGVGALLIFTRKQSSHISEIRDHMKQLLEEARETLPEEILKNSRNSGRNNREKDDTRDGS